MEQNIMNVIQEAQMILVGIGREFSPVCPKEQEKSELWPYLQSRFYEQLPADHAVIRAYDALRRLIGAKPYFAVTMNTDDLIYRSKLEPDLIVAPCGSLQKMQCTEHIVDARPIRDAVLAQAERTEDAAAESADGTKQDIFAGAVCPICGEPVRFHTVETEGYLERGYLPQWEKYTKWLQATLNHRLCILELGVDFTYPQVVRWPFEKVATYNQKATLIRVSEHFWQLPEHLAGRGISVAQNPVDYLTGAETNF